MHWCVYRSLLDLARIFGLVVGAAQATIWLSLAVADAAVRPDETEANAKTDPVGQSPRSPAAFQPATKPAAKILDLHAEIAESLTQTKYQHRTVIRRKDGVYLWDCSGMAAWMLKRTAPAARKALDKGRPVARDFARQIRRAPTGRARNGWQQIARIQDVRPGDLFAWERPPGFKSKNTGHVGFALAPAEPSKKWRNAYTVRILDATSLLHDDDSRPEGGEGGFGEGTILFTTDRDGHGTAYGWFGDRSRGVITTPIYFGRVWR